jgi:organic radical activating enzyme
VTGQDSALRETNFKNHESRATTKSKKGETFCQEEREGRQEIVDQKSRKADVLQVEQNQKVKGEFEMIDPIDAQMEATVQETRQNVIKTRWGVIVKAHKIVDMDLYVKKFVQK